MLVIFMEYKTKFAFIRKDDRNYETREERGLQKIRNIFCKIRLEILDNRCYYSNSKIQ